MRTLACGLCLVALLSGCRQDAFCLNCEDRDAGSNNGGSGGSGDGDSSVAGDGGGDDEDGGGFGGNGGTGGGPAACEPLGNEVCNGLDDDCDGQFDEDFDFSNNPRHCGGCDKVCEGQNSETACQDGQCVLTTCLPGYVDLDGTPGCEYFCPVSPTKPEDCNGIDDDCDNRVDEELTEPDADDFCNTLGGTPCADIGLTCATREGRTTWYCEYPSTVQFDPIVPNGIFQEETLCDGNDNDCDGVVDDPWPELGDTCDDGQLGACANGGRMVCNSDKASTQCDLSLPPDALPGAGADATELCNGVDDNCDGIVDNSAPGDAKRVRDDMIHVMRGGFDFYIYKYEASRPDSSATEAGISNARACSKSGAQPWSYVTFAAATAACTASGLRLCTAAEWEAACEGAGLTTYPYGGSYAADTCNGTNHDVTPPGPPSGPVDNSVLACGALSSCVSTDGVFDMSGNLKEWTNDQQGTSGGENVYVVRGGSYESPQLGLTCQTTLSQASASTVLPNVGFRCCSTTAQ